MHRCYLTVLAALGLSLLGCRSGSSAGPRAAAGSLSTEVAVVPGGQADGSVLLPNQWSLRPAGKQVLVGDFPVSIALHPGGRFAAVLHSGYGNHEVVIVDIPAAKVVSQVTLEECFYGITFSRDGRRLLTSGAGREEIHLFNFQDGYLSGHQTVRLRDPRLRGVPSGVVFSPEGDTAYVANLWGHRISQVALKDSRSVDRWILAEGELAVALRSEDAAVNPDTDAITKRSEAILELARDDAPYPYGLVLDDVHQRLYVSLWAQSAVQVIDLKTGLATARWKVEEHPNEMVLSRDAKRLFVANANRNSVSVLDTATGALQESLIAELLPDSPPGSTPNSLALSPDEKQLYVANANINAVAVFDVSVPGKSRSLGFIPTGWYPTSVRVTPDGKSLLIANGKGLISKANRHGPQAGREAPASVREYIGGLLQGTLSIVPLPRGEKFEEQMKAHTAKVYAGMPAAVTNSAANLEPGHPIPLAPGGVSPIRHVLYILKENRTYDQVLGDMREGNGDPSLCIFPERVTPNHHKLAREFVLLDNFYVESEVSADGHEWSVGAYATDFVEKMWPLSYGHNQQKKYTYPAEGNFNIAAPAGGYLWDRAKAAGVTYRSYGEFIRNGRKPGDPAYTRVAALQGHFDPGFHGFDMDYSDLKRADRFIHELHRFEREGEMPRLQILRLGNDHTAGTSVGKPTPTAYLAENDLALGRVIEAVSHSKFWPNLAVFVVEDDAQNGPDHVDAHRTIAYVLGPHVKRRAVDSTLYSTASMLRTMELILGLQPMSQFDAAARPMLGCFTARPDLRPYSHEPARVSLTQTNLAVAWGAKASGRMNFAREDAADDFQLNQIIWRSVKGPESPMPAPVRAGFVLAKRGGDDDDD